MIPRLLLWGALFALPGWLMARRLVAREPAATRVAVAAALALTVVGWGGWAIAATGGLLLRFHLGPASLAAAGALGVAAVYGLTRGRPRETPAPWTRADAVAVALAVAIGALWLVRLDPLRFTQHHCIPASALIALGDFLSGAVPEVDADAAGRNLSLLARFGQREGGVAFLASQLAVLERAGFRGSMALAGFLVTLGGWALGRTLLGQARWGLLLGAALGLEPVALSIHHPSPNLFAFALSAVVLALATGPPRPALVGAIGAFTVAVAHTLLPAALLLPFAAWGRDRRHLARYAAGFALFALPIALSHVEGIFESFGKYPAMPHCLGPLCFEWHGLLNWPFQPELRRDLYRAHPAMLRFPLELVAHHGAVAVGLAVAGAAALARRGAGRFGALAAVWCGPALVALLLQSNWVERAKSGTLLPLLVPFVAAVVAGIAALADPGRRRRAAAVAAIATGAAALAAATLGRLDFPADEERFDRVYAAAKEAPHIPARAPEQASYVALDRERLARARAWPLYLEDLRATGDAAWRWRLAAARDELARPAFGAWRPTVADRFGAVLGTAALVPGGLSAFAAATGAEPGPREGASGAARELALDLSAPFAARDDAVGAPRGDEELGVDLTVDGEVLVRGIGAPWHGEEVALVAIRGDVHSIVFLTNAPPGGLAEPPRGTRVLDAGGATRLRLRVPAATPLVLTDVLSWEPAWDESWLVRFAEEGPGLARLAPGLD